MLKKIKGWLFGSKTHTSYHKRNVTITNGGEGDSNIVTIKPTEPGPNGEGGRGGISVSVVNHGKGNIIKVSGDHEVVSTDLDINHEDPTILWMEIHKLRDQVKGPEGFETWRDAAVHERVRRVNTENELKTLKKNSVLISKDGKSVWIEGAGGLDIRYPETPNLTCVDKDGDYINMGVASGAGILKGNLYCVYKNITGDLFIRDPIDFAKRMTRIEGSADCELPPKGWYCTRTPGHEGPCAAHPEK